MKNQLKNFIVSSIFISSLASAAPEVPTDEANAIQKFSEISTQYKKKAKKLYNFWLAGFFSGYTQGYDEGLEENSSNPSLESSLAHFSIAQGYAEPLGYEGAALKDERDGAPRVYFENGSAGGILDIDFQWDCAARKLRVVSMQLNGSIKNLYTNKIEGPASISWSESEWVELDENQPQIEGGTYRQKIIFKSLSNVEYPSGLFSQGLDLTINELQLSITAGQSLYQSSENTHPSLLYKSLGNSGITDATIRVLSSKLDLTSFWFQKVNLRTPMSLDECDAIGG